MVLQYHNYYRNYSNHHYTYARARVKILLEKKLIDKDLVEKLMGYNIYSLWEKREPIIQERRKTLKTSHWWNVEELYDQIKDWVDQEYFTAPRKQR